MDMDKIMKDSMDKVVLNESEQRKVDLITEEFKARGGMDDEELISRLNAIPFEEFMNKLEKRIKEYGRGTNQRDEGVEC